MQPIFEQLEKIKQSFAAQPTDAYNKALIWNVINKKLAAEHAFDFALHRQVFDHVFGNEEFPIAWLPDNSTIQHANISRWIQQLGLKSYRELYRWSVNHPAEYWRLVADTLQIQFKKPYRSVLDLSVGVETPVWFAEARMNITDSCLQHNRNKVAIFSGNEAGEIRQITYGELTDKVNIVAAALLQQGLQAGDRVAMYAPLSAETAIAYLAIVRAGLEAVLIADSFSAIELQKRIEITNTKAIVTYDDYQYGGKRLPMYAKVTEAQAPKAFVISEHKQTTLRQGDIWFSDLQAPALKHSHAASPSDTITVLFSSGTTKVPKAIPWSHTTPLRCGADAWAHIDVKPSDVITWTTSMGWMMGPWLLFAALLNGSTAALFSGSGASPAFADFVKKTGVTIMGTIPSLVKVWRSQQTMNNAMQNVRLFASTGEPSNADDYLYLMSLAGYRAPVIEYCGGTEVGGAYITATVLQPASPATFTTPTLGYEILFLNQNIKPIQSGETGEVFIVPPTIGLSQRLLNKDHHEEYYAGCPAGPNGEILRRHGDAHQYVEIALHGETATFYKSHGRTDDAMNLGGIKISAVELEEVINQHAAVQQSAAVSVQEKDGPEQLIVYFAAKEPNYDKALLKKELQQLLSTKLNPLFRISDVIEIAVLPRTASNKIMRRELRKMYLDSR